MVRRGRALKEGGDIEREREREKGGEAQSIPFFIFARIRFFFFSLLFPLGKAFGT